MAAGPSSAEQSLTVFVHSNLPQLDANFTLNGASLVSGWSEASHETELRRPGVRWHNATRLRGAAARLGLAQTLKYEWLSRIAADRPQPWLLTDTDVIVQCTAAELARRFASFGVPLVVSAERWLFPQPEPYGTLPNELIRRAWPRAPPTAMRYPNSGVLMTTRAGLQRLVRALRTLPDFPCCRWWPPTMGACRVDDQGCLHAALQQLTRGADYELDRDGELFLNMFMLRPNETSFLSGGRLAFQPGGGRRPTEPCVLHYNGLKGDERALAAAQLPAATWVPVPRLSASLRGGWRPAAAAHPAQS